MTSGNVSLRCKKKKIKEKRSTRIEMNKSMIKIIRVNGEHLHDMVNEVS